MDSVQQANDAVNHPAHYNRGRMEVIEVLKLILSREMFLGFLTGNIIKYILRHEFKNGTEDLKKAAWYLNRLIEEKQDECKGIS